MELRRLKQGEYFTRKPHNGEEAKASSVWVRGGYDRGNGLYEVYKWDDVNKTSWLKGSATVYTDFVF